MAIFSGELTRKYLIDRLEKYMLSDFRRSSKDVVRNNGFMVNKTKVSII